MAFFASAALPGALFSADLCTGNPSPAGISILLLVPARLGDPHVSSAGDRLPKIEKLVVSMDKGRSAGRSYLCCPAAAGRRANASAAYPARCIGWVCRAVVMLKFVMEFAQTNSDPKQSYAYCICPPGFPEADAEFEPVI